MSHIRPFRARVVRPEWARRLVTGLAELPEDTGTLPPVAPPDPTAYDESEAALYVYRQGDHTGVVCEVDVRPFVDGQVRGHEAVQAQRVDSLVKHMETDAAPALVALLHHAGPTLPPGSGRADDVAAAARLRRTQWPRAAGLAGATGRCHRGPRRGADRLRPLHRRRSPPGRGLARGLAAARRARGREHPVRRAPDGRFAAVGVPPAGARPGGPRRAGRRARAGLLGRAARLGTGPRDWLVRALRRAPLVRRHAACRRRRPRRGSAHDAGARPPRPRYRDRARANPRGRADPPVRQRRGCALHARAATARGAHPTGGRRRGDAAEDDVLRAQAVRRDLPAP